MGGAPAGHGGDARPADPRGADGGRSGGDGRWRIERADRSFHFL